MKSLWERLAHYGVSSALPMHMPGHKRKKGYLGGITQYDITEVTGFDDLHHPEGLLKEAMEEAASLYHSKASYLLVNGSTCGILSAITAATKPGDKILLSRNCHKSALNAVTLLQLEPIWLEPPIVSDLHVYGSIPPDAVKEAFAAHPEITAVLLVSPTYEGIVSDVRTIAEICHHKGVPLLIDEAHGAHFHFSADFPADALSCGADIVVESLHKTLPALTQTAILHLQGTLIPEDRLRFALQSYESSSPSYLLMASAIECIKTMAEQGQKLMADYWDHLTALRKALSALEESFLLSKNADDAIFDYDPGKIVIGFHSYHGGEIQGALLRQHRVEIEMAAPGYIVAMTSPFDSSENFFRFQSAVTHLRQDLPLKGKAPFPFLWTNHGEKAMLPGEALYAEKEILPLKEAQNRIAAETVYLYPPGSPLIAAGEYIREEELHTIKECEKKSFTIHGIKNGQIKVIK